MGPGDWPQRRSTSLAGLSWIGRIAVDVRLLRESRDFRLLTARLEAEELA